MKTHRRRILIAFLSTVLCLSSTLALNVQPASANASQGYVAGADDPTDDLGDESTLTSYGSYWHSNYAAVWQLMLWVDGELDRSQVDCGFGPVTADATYRWHANYIEGYPPTSAFDDRARANAGMRLTRYSTSSDGDYIQYVNDSYASGPRILRIHRHSGSYSSPYAWDVQNPWNTTEWHTAWYGSHNFSFCK